MKQTKLLEFAICKHPELTNFSIYGYEYRIFHLIFLHCLIVFRMRIISPAKVEINNCMM